MSVHLLSIHISSLHYTDFLSLSLCICVAIYRLCSLTISRLSLLTPLPADLTSLSLAVKMQSSKRTLRSHEIPVPQCALVGHTCTPQSSSSSAAANCGGSAANNATTAAAQSQSTATASGGGGGGASAGASQSHSNQMTAGHATISSTNSCGAFGTFGSANGGTSAEAGGGGGAASGGGGGCGTAGCGTPQSTLLETDLDLHFSLQYPHFIKRDGNR